MTRWQGRYSGSRWISGCDLNSQAFCHSGSAGRPLVLGCLCKAPKSTPRSRFMKSMGKLRRAGIQKRGMSHTKRSIRMFYIPRKEVQKAESWSFRTSRMSRPAVNSQASTIRPSTRNHMDPIQGRRYHIEQVLSKENISGPNLS